MSVFIKRNLVFRAHKEDLGTKCSTLPRSIWSEGLARIFYENYLNRTRIRENNKKVRKNWTSSWGVLTARHLSFFKDPKFKNAQVNGTYNRYSVVRASILIFSVTPVNNFFTANQV